MDLNGTYTAFEGTSRFFHGSFQDVVLKIKERLGRAENSPMLIFSDETGKTMDFNFQGSTREVLKRLETYVSRQQSQPSSGPGRPRLGVISREISLLPRHWEWLANQPGGTSATIRNLVEEARKRSSSRPGIRQLQERAYRVMSGLAGDMQNYQEALRALYRADRKKFLLHIEEWPADVRSYVIELAQPVFKNERQARRKTVVQAES